MKWYLGPKIKDNGNYDAKARRGYAEINLAFTPPKPSEHKLPPKDKECRMGTTQSMANLLPQKSISNLKVSHKENEPIKTFKRGESVKILMESK